MDQAFGCLPLAYDFWTDFEYFELTQSMRQKDELDFYLFLNRIRHWNP